MTNREKFIRSRVEAMQSRDCSQMRDYYAMGHHMREFGRQYDEQIRSRDMMADSRSYARDAEDRIESEDELEEGDWDALDSDDLEDEYDPDDLD